MSNQILVKNQHGRLVRVTQDMLHRNKNYWTVVDENRDEHNNLDTTAQADAERKYRESETKKIKELTGQTETVDASDVEEVMDNLDNMNMTELRAKCKELEIKQPFGSSAEALRELIRNA